MKIKKYKYLNNSKYKIYIDDEEYIIYEDIIVKNNILLKQGITKEELNLYLKENEYYDALYRSIKYLGIKMRTKKEIIKYLQKNTSEKIINRVIKKLDDGGYLNESTYTKAYICDAINLKNIGPYKIEKYLLELGISENIIKEELTIYNSETEVNKIEKIISKEIKLNKNKSLNILKAKIYYNLINLGFTKEYINKSLNSINIDDTEILKKEYDKLYKKLSQKYQGQELEYKIKQKMYAKGFK